MDVEEGKLEEELVDKPGTTIGTKFSKDYPGGVRLVCRRMRHVVETVLLDVALRPAIDRFVFLSTRSKLTRKK